jgi:hypothetical protein
LSAWLPLLVIYLSLAGYGLDHQSLWKDEILSIRDASSATTIWNKGHGPLYFALLHVWKHLTVSDLGLRALSVLLGALALCLFYATCTTLCNRRVALFSTLLFATSPFVIWYSQEVRYVILTLATTLLAMYTFLRLEKRGGWIQWLIYCSALLLALASFIANVFLLPAHGLYLLCSPSRRQMWGAWLVCVTLLSILFGGWAIHKFANTIDVSASASGQQSVSIDLKKLSRGAANAFSPALLPYTFFAFSTGFSQGPSVHDLHQSQSLTVVRPYIATLASRGLLFGSLFIVGLIAIWRQPDSGKLLTLWMFVPLGGVLVTAFITSLGFNVRYTAMVFPAYLLIVTSGIAWFRQRVIQLVLLAAVLCSNGLSLANYYTNPYYARADGRAAVQYLKEVRQARDVILVVGSTRALTYYSKGNLPFEVLDARHATDHDLQAALRRITRGGDRLWVIEIRPWERDPKGRIKSALNRIYNCIEQKKFPGVAIRHYQIATPDGRQPQTSHASMGDLCIR